ncbi:MAG TPA: hypothetical protein VLJ76_06560 [Gaiellaceae bacterium]|nr:hypothetical protein [Gaiellaceae bacterium]
MRRWAAAGLAAGAIAAVAVVIGVQRGWWSGSASPPPGLAISAQGSIAPQASQFGDTLRAQAVITLVPARVDPATVRLVPHFLSFTVANSKRTVSHEGGATTITYNLALDCFGAGCAPGRPQVVLDFPNASVQYRTTNDRAKRLGVTWPEITIASRLSDADRLDPSVHFRADTSPPPVSYDVSPGALAIGLVVGSALLVLGAAGLVLLAFRRRTAPAAAPLLVEGSPLAHALRLVRETASNGNHPEQRRLALQRLVRELRATDAEKLADDAGRLAWSDGPPSTANANEFADQVEKEIGE